VKTIRLGTRASALARWQADWVAAQLHQRGLSVEMVPITTHGDSQQTAPIATIGAQGVFTSEIQRALLDRRIDVAVHSMKDLTTAPVEGLRIAAVPERASVCDVLVSRQGQKFDELPAGATIGTGSVRRRAQLLHARADLTMADVRGNVDTRLLRLDEGQYDAIILAEAGLLRLGLSERITQGLSPSVMLPAVGQGALAIEARADDAATFDALAALDHEPTHRAVDAERALLRHVQGGCLAPVGAWARMEGGQLRLDAAVLSSDGRTKLTNTATAEPDDAESLGRRVADALLEQGAAALVQAAR